MKARWLMPVCTPRVRPDRWAAGGYEIERPR